MNHMMIDLETLATSANAQIVSVGACVFTETSIIRQGYWVLDLKEQALRGRVFAADTIKWWMNQSDEARKVFKEPSVSLTVFSHGFRSLFVPGEPLCLWGNGADFDMSIMVDLYERTGIPKIDEWRYYNHMCYRTFNKLFKCKGLVPRKGTHHNALDDAIYQAECVIASGKLKEFKV